MSKQLLDEFFLNLNVTITLYPETETVTFKTIENFLEYIIKEKEFWHNVSGEIRERFQNTENYITTSLQHADSNIEHAKNQLQQAINYANQRQWPTLYSKTSVAQYIKKQMQLNAALGDAAIQYLLKRQVNNIHNYEYFKGYMNAFIFEESAKAFNEAAATQEATLTELHSDYHSQLNRLNEEYHRVTSVWRSELDNKVAAWNHESEEFKNNTSSWKENVEKETENALTNTLKELELIQKKYTEKLRLEGPATYWAQLETEYNKAGNRWRCWAVVTTVIFIALMTFILLINPDSKLIVNGVLNVNSLRNALILTLITSMSIYIITLFVKLSVSSYHLARDAKERYQITHVYLSLLNENENAIKDAERVTVLQAIFSRADTGLLKGDSGPSIPDSLSQIIKLLKK